MNMREEICDYLEHCRYEKNLNAKTIKAYGIDLEQFRIFCSENEEIKASCNSPGQFMRNAIKQYMKQIHDVYSNKTIKRKIASLNKDDMSVLIRGKGAKERIIQIGNAQVINITRLYMKEFAAEIQETGYLFVTKNKTRFSEQAARAMIHKYRNRIGEKGNITPHMFRHAFATYLLEEDVDIRYIQRMLGHSSINTTQLYCYVSMEKQRQILTDKNPRNHMLL